MACSIPPHNAGELCDALLHLIKTPNARIDTLVDLVKGPDFPTGGVLVEPRESIVEAYKTGRGAFRLRARWTTEQLPRGQYRIIVTEIPYQVQKGRLIERIAEIINAKKLPILDDVRDELADDVRIVLEPRTGNVPAELLMEQLFKLTDLEIRFPLNLNVLDEDNTPRVMDLREALQAFLDHRREVLVRRSTFRLEAIERRLEILDGYLIAYLNLDELIKIIREEDEPKPKMIKALRAHRHAGRGDPEHAPARAAPARRIRDQGRAQEALGRAQGTEGAAQGREAAVAGDRRRGPGDQAQVRRQDRLGQRRTELADAPAEIEHAVEDFVEREPITVVCSDKGWIRAAKGHLDDKQAADLKFKEGDGPRFALHAQSTDKILVFGTNGRFYTLRCDKLPSARGHGEPIRLMIELGNEQDIVQLEVFKGGRKFLVASDAGRGFVVPEDEVVAQTKNGKQVLNLADKEKAAGLLDHARGCRLGRRAERRPQAPDLPAGPGAGDGPRPRRAAAEVEGRPAVRRAGLQARRRSAVGEPADPGRRAEVLARRARAGGPHAGKGLAARQTLQGLIGWT